MNLWIDIQDTLAEPIPSQEQIQGWIMVALKANARLNNQPLAEEVEITIRIVDEQEIQELNHQYRSKDKPTNILSFPFQAPDYVELPLLGDLVICRGVVEQEAIEQHKSREAHWAHIIIHGVLHLLEHDHILDGEAEIMENLEKRILEELGFDDPY